MNYPKKEQQRNKAQSPFNGLEKIRKSVRKQGLLAIATILLTVVMVFAMTTAWYTNVAQTNGLTFTTQSWGVNDVEIQVGTTAFEIYPGAVGVVPLTLTNKTATIASVGVSVVSNASNLADEMGKRMFFYVEQSQRKNGEYVDRTYISGGNVSYTFTLLPGETIHMDGSGYNAAPVKWTWVYDMLGYYISGTKQPNGDVAVSQYLRPIEYKYDEATFDENGRLLTVDGVTTVDAFLETLSGKDGYLGTIDTAAVTEKGYYPVDVDENGTGIWAYLCTYTEIEQGILYDTQMAQTMPSFQVQLKFTTKNESTVQAQVGSVDQLQEALLDRTVDVIQLEKDLVLSESIDVPSGTQAVVDLNGHTISMKDLTENQESEKVAFLTETDAQLVLINGKIEGTGTGKEVAVKAIGAQITMSGMTLTNVYRGVDIKDQLSQGDSVVRVSNSAISATNIGLFIQGNGEASDGITRLVVENCSIDGGYVAISGQGSSGAGNQLWGTDIQLTNCKLNANLKGESWAGIYHPQQNSTLNIQGGQIHGYTGIAVKGGNVVIQDATIHGYGQANAAADAASGWTDTGDGIYLEAVYRWKATVELRGDNMNVISDHGMAVQLFEKTGFGPGSIYIYGNGTYKNGQTDMDITDFKVD